MRLHQRSKHTRGFTNPFIAFAGSLSALFTLIFGAAQIPTTLYYPAPQAAAVAAAASNPYPQAADTNAAIATATPQILALSRNDNGAPESESLANQQTAQHAGNDPNSVIIATGDLLPADYATNAQLSELAAALTTAIASLSGQGSAPGGADFATTPVTHDFLTRQVDAISRDFSQADGYFLPLTGGTLIGSLAVDGVSGLTITDIPDLSSKYVAVGGGSTISGLTSFTNASTTLLSVLGPAYFGTTATSTFGADGSLTLSGALTLNGNKTYTGASAANNSFMFMPGSALFGTASAASNGIISPFNLYISGDTVDTTTSGNGNLIGFSIEHAVGANHTGGREAFQSYLAVVGTPAVAPGTAGYVGGQAMLRADSNLTGTSGSYANYAGSAFAANADIFLQSGATYYKTVNAEEFDVAVPSGASTADKYGISIVKTSSDAIRGAYDDSAISINDQDNASTAGWHYGISFGSYAHQWAFATDSTLIMAQQRQTGPASASVALNGVDFRNVTFTVGGDVPPVFHPGITRVRG